MRISFKELSRFRCYYCNYCGLQTLLRYKRPDYYLAGQYGWDADIYVLSDGRAIVTGYRRLKGTRIPEETCKEYEANAKNIHDEKALEDLAIELLDTLEQC